MRDFYKVARRLIAAAPDLKDKIAPVMEAARYTAPEAMAPYFERLSMVLNSYAQDHPQEQLLIRIFNDRRLLDSIPKKDLERATVEFLTLQRPVAINFDTYLSECAAAEVYALDCGKVTIGKKEYDLGVLIRELLDCDE